MCLQTRLLSAFDSGDIIRRPAKQLGGWNGSYHESVTRFAAAVSADAIVPAYADRIGEALEAGILIVERDRVRFSHPLLASTVYTDAPPEKATRDA
jgi:hypothetical protein